MHSYLPSTDTSGLTRQRFWYLPTITVARFILRSYIRSGWILGDIVYIWFLYAFLFLEVGGNVAYFYGTAGQGLGVLAVLDTIVMVQRSLKNARVYLPLARLSSRSTYIRGLILATGVLRVPLFLLTLLLALGYHHSASGWGIEGATFWNMLPGALGLLLNCVLLTIVTVLLLAPVATRRIQIVFLVWLAAVLYTNAGVNGLTHYLSIVQIPLAPLAACYQLGFTATINGYGLAMLLLTIGYIVGLTYLTDVLFSRRDLILS